MSKQNTYWYIPHNSKKTRQLHPTSLDWIFAFISVASILFIVFAGLQNRECVGNILAIALCQLTAYSIVGILQINEPQMR